MYQSFNKSVESDVTDVLKMAKRKLKKERVNVNKLNPKKVPIINEQIKIEDNQTAIFG